MLFSDAFRREHPERVAELVEPFQRHRPPPWTVQFQTLAASCFSRRGDLHRVRAPTLIVHGEDDAMSPAANARALAEGIPGAELWMIPGGGHAAPLEHAEESAERLLAWVDRHAVAVPPRTGRRAAVTERLTRPFALHAGAARNTAQLVPAVRSRLRG